MSPIPENLEHAAYNLDRAVASLFGAPPQETISSEVGRAATHDELAAFLARILNRIQPGHTAHAVAHADALAHVDDGFEG